MSKLSTRRLGIFIGLLLLVSACAGKTTPQIAATVATHGRTLMTAVQRTQQAVIDAEAKGAIPRNAAVKSMETFQKIGLAGEDAAELLDTLVTLDVGSVEAKTTIEKIQIALDLVDSQMFAALVPIGDEATRAQVGTLAAEVSRLISTINREILGGVR